MEPEQKRNIVPNATSNQRYYSFFERTPETYNVEYSTFGESRLVLNLSKPEFKNFTNPGLEITLEMVEYPKYVSYTLTVCSAFLIIQAVGIVYNMVRICRDQSKADLEFPGVILFYVNSNVMLSLESNRIDDTNTLFDFLSFGSYYTKCLLIGLYVAILRTRMRQTDEKFSNISMVIVVFTCILFCCFYYFCQEIDMLYVVSSLLPVLFQCYNSYRKAELQFTIGFTFFFKFFQIAQILFLASLSPPYTLVPDAEHIVRPSMLLVAVTYTIVMAQIIYHPKLFMRWQHLKAEMKYRPVRRRVSDLPEKENGYSCIICMDDFEDEQEEGVWTYCNHFFHERCLEDWLKINKKCPICKSKCLSMDYRND